MQFATVRKVILMNSLTHFQHKARKSIQKCCLPATLSTMNTRRHDIPYFLRSFARKAKTDASTEQSLAPQNTDDMISVPVSVPSLSYAASHTYTRRNKLLTGTEDHHQYALRKRTKEDTYRFIDAPSLEKHILSFSTRKEPEEIDINIDASATVMPEAQRNDMSQQSKHLLDEEEEKKLKAVMISNTVNRLRQWRYTDYGKMHLQSQQHGLEFTITSYNILAQELLEDNSWLYRCVEPEVLRWDYRCRNLVRELRSLQSDIICLQEVQSDHYESVFKPNFESLGYECLYKKRTGDKGDGCAVLFRKSMFTLIKHQEVEFNKPGIPLLDRDNVGLIVLLRPRGLPSLYDTHLCIATTHLLFNPRRGDVKLAQLRLLLAEIDRLAFRRYCDIKQKTTYHPVILCGDMNSEPFSPLYDFLCKGSLSCDSLLSGDISGQTEGANRGRILNPEELLHPEIAITENSQYSELQRSRQEQRYSHVSNASKEDSWNEILTVNQSMQWPVESFANSSEKSTHSSLSSSSIEPLPKSSLSPTHALTISHYFNFNSAYSHFCSGKHEVTTHHSKANCTVDYIFYSTHSKNHYLNDDTDEHKQVEKGSLYHLASYRLLNDTEMEELGGLPNSYQSSDHLSLASKFLLKFS